MQHSYLLFETNSLEPKDVLNSDIWSDKALLGGNFHHHQRPQRLLWQSNSKLSCILIRTVELTGTGCKIVSLATQWFCSTCFFGNNFFCDLYLNLCKVVICLKVYTSNARKGYEPPACEQKSHTAFGLHCLASQHISEAHVLGNWK